MSDDQPRADDFASDFGASRSLVVRILLPLAWLALLLELPGWVVAAPPAKPPRQQFALLVGCTRYDHLPDYHQLVGPANDVSLMRSVLQDVGGFSAAQIEVLSEDSGEPKKRPTRHNIATHFERIAGEVGPGDFVFLHLSGHGSRQPDDDPDDPADLEPDGQDEVFCPADGQITPASSGRIENGIRDDEFRCWLDKMLAAGADVFFVADTCHSGTMTRAGDDRVARTFHLEARGPGGSLRISRNVAAAERGGGTSDRPQVKNDGRLVALYAAQPFELAYEASFPEDSPTATRFGLLSYTLARILRQTKKSLTYRDLVRRIHAEYLAAGITSPTPFVEGQMIDRLVFDSGSRPPKGRYRMRRELARYCVNGGELHGLTAGSVLAVYPDAAGGSDTPLGHVRVTELGPLSSIVAPCQFGSSARVRDLPTPCTARLVYTELAGKPLRVAVDHAGQSSHEPLSADNELLIQLKRLESVSLQVVEDPFRADWLIRRRAGRLFLTPREAMLPKGSTRFTSEELQEFGPLPDRDAVDWLETRLARLARTQRLVQFAASCATRLETTADVGVNLVEYESADDVRGRLVDASARRPILAAGTIVAFELINRGKTELDISLIFLDAHFGIRQIFPAAGMADNRIQPGARFRTRRFRVDPRSTGLEHVVAIGVRGAPFEQPMQFDFLEQRGLEVAETRGRSAGPTRDSAEQPILNLLIPMLDPAEATRGQSENATPRNWTLKLLTWRTAPENHHQQGSLRP